MFLRISLQKIGEGPFVLYPIFELSMKFCGNICYRLKALTYLPNVQSRDTVRFYLCNASS